MPEEPGALWMPNANFFVNRDGHKPLYIILHGTAGGTSAQGIANYFLSTVRTNNPVSSHYVIGTDGTVVQMVSESDGAWANGYLSTGHAAFWDATLAGANPNDITISIEHCKSSADNSDVLTNAQQAASFKLQYDICKRWGIPMRAANASGGITGHFSLDPINRANCPGPYPWNALWNYLQGGNTVSGVPTGWKDDGKTLTASNGVTCTLGFRDYVLKNSWDPQNIPLQGAQGLNPLELSNPSLGAGTQQIFRWIVLEWTSKQGVYVAWSGGEILTLRSYLSTAQSKIATQNTQIADLQKQIANATDTSALEQQIATQTTQINQLNQQLTVYKNKLEQIATLAQG